MALLPDGGKMARYRDDHDEEAVFKCSNVQSRKPVRYHDYGCIMDERAMIEVCKGAAALESRTDSEGR